MERWKAGALKSMHTWREAASLFRPVLDFHVPNRFILAYTHELCSLPSRPHPSSFARLQAWQVAAKQIHPDRLADSICDSLAI
jgi:hypothetical protein